MGAPFSIVVTMPSPLTPHPSPGEGGDRAVQGGQHAQEPPGQHRLRRLRAHVGQDHWPRTRPALHPVLSYVTLQSILGTGGSPESNNLFTKI